MTSNIRDDMDLDDQEQLFFRHMGPLSGVRRDPNRAESSNPPQNSGAAKRPRVEGPERSKGRGGKGKGKGKAKGKGGPPPGPSLAQGIYPSARMWAYSNGSNEGSEMPAPWSADRQGHQEWLEERMDRLTQMVLRQEQTLSALRQDLMLYLFVRSGEQGMIPILCQAADKWRQLKEETPEKLGYSLKLAMFKQLMITLQERLTETSKNPQAMDHAKSLNWVDREGCWRILKWNGTKQNLEIDTTVQPTSTENLLSQIVQVRKAINETSLIRFKSIRRLTEGVQTEWVTFQIFVSLRPEGSPIWSSLTSWIGQAAFHAIEARPATIRCIGGQPLGMNTGAIPSLRMLLKVSLHNDTNLCYLNSTALAATWALLQAQLHGHPTTHLASALRLLCNREGQAHNLSVKLFNHLPWQMLLQGWANVHQQHGAPELVMHLLPRLHTSSFEGRWEARVSTERALRITDTGRLHAPIIMFPHPGDTLYLQRVIDQWHLQACMPW